MMKNEKVVNNFSGWPWMEGRFGATSENRVVREWIAMRLSSDAFTVA
jgi:hypothetical protein